MNRSGFYFTVTLLCLLLSLPELGFGQQVQYEFDQEFNWSDATEEKTFYIDVKSGSSHLKMDFEGKISQGNLDLTAFDPDNNKVAGFSLVCSSGEETGSSSSISVGRNSNSNSNPNSDSNAGSGSNSSSTTTVTANGQSTVTMSTGASEGASSAKVKRKHKDKNKAKNGTSYSTATTNSDARGAKGVMNKKITDPSPGRWKFVISVSGVSGNLEAEIEQE